MKITLRTAALLLTLAALAPAQATFWVDAVQGSDTNNGSVYRPFMSITKGVASLRTGDTLFVLPGTYSPALTGERLPIDVGAGAVKQDRVRIIAAFGPGYTTLDAGGAGGTSTPAVPYMIRFHPGARGAQLFGLHLTHMNIQNPGVGDTAVRLGDPAGGTGAAASVELTGCMFTSVVRGVTLWQTDGGGHKVHHNLVIAPTVDGLAVHGNPTNPGRDLRTHVYNNTITGAGRTGLYMDDKLVNLVAVNNIAAYGKDRGFAGDFTSASVAFLYNCAWANKPGSDWVLKTSLSKSNLTVDPLFVDPLKGDFQLRPTSPLVGAGWMKDLSLFNTPDLFSNAALFDLNGDGQAKVDIGCHEVADVGLQLSGTWGPGQTVTVTHSAPAGYMAIDLMALGVPGLALPNLGTLLLDPLKLIPGAVFLNPGTGSWKMPIPNNPYLRGGITVFIQTIYFNTTPSFKVSNLQMGVF